MGASARSVGRIGGIFLGLLTGMSGCGDAASDTTATAATTGTSLTGLADPGTADTSATLPPTSGGTTEGGGTQGMTSTPTTGGTTIEATSTPGDTTVDPSADSTNQTTDVSTSTSTGPVTVSTGETTADSDPSNGTSSTDGPKLDAGNPVCPPDNQATTFDFIWIANTSQVTVSKIETLSAANSGVYGRIQRVA